MPVQPFASVTVTVIGNEPVCVGVPERTPAAESVRPAGSVLAGRENVAAADGAGLRERLAEGDVRRCRS